MIDTCCKDCIFAQYDGITQIKCAANRIENYRQHNIEVIEAYDEEKEFYVIPNRICVYKRSKNWGNKFNQTEWINQVKKELILKYIGIIIINDHNTIDDARQTYHSLLSQTTPPQKVFVINLNTKLNRILIFNGLYVSNESPLRIDQPIDITEGPYPQIDLLINTGNIIGHFYLVINAGNTLPSNFNKIEHAIYEDLKQFVVIKHQDFILYSIQAHIMCNGNKDDTLLSKLLSSNMTAQFDEL